MFVQLKEKQLLGPYHYHVDQPKDTRQTVTIVRSN